MKIKDYQLHRLRLVLREPIGDSQVRFEEHWMTVLELVSEEGLTGTGFEIQQGVPTASLANQKDQFEYGSWPTLVGADPISLALRIDRPRGGNVGVGYRSLMVETALWDLVGKRLGMPLFQLFGGIDPRVSAYASTLDFHLSDQVFRNKLERFYKRGFRSVKIKVGHPDLDWDLRRLKIAREVMPGHLMVDANEAWSVKEAIRRLNRFRDAGHDLFWVEDPITRGDYPGYAQLCGVLPFVRINTGEYLGYSGKRQLLEAHAVDVLNLHGSVAMTRDAARLAADYGVPVSLGNTILELGVHLAASLPECLYLEFSDLRWNDLAQQPVVFEEGYALAPDRPGHGIELNREVLVRLSDPG